MSAREPIFRISRREKRIFLACMAYPLALFFWGLTPGGFDFFSSMRGVFVMGGCPLWLALCAFYFLVVSESRNKVAKFVAGFALTAAAVLALCAVEVQCWNAMRDLNWSGAECWRHTLTIFTLQFVPFSFVGW